MWENEIFGEIELFIVVLIFSPNSNFPRDYVLPETVLVVCPSLMDLGCFVEIKGPVLSLRWERQRINKPRAPRNDL